MPRLRPWPAFLAATLLLASCTTGPEITGPSSYAVNSSDYYDDTRNLFLGDLDQAQQHTAPLKPLLHPYEVGVAATEERGRLVAHGDPLGVIVSGVWLPEDLPRAMDVAVILDITTASRNPVTSLVVFYQRGATGGQFLSFSNLLVYVDEQWDGVTPPYFRLRVLDVAAERNARTRDLLERVGSLSGTLGGLVPHPIMPVVGLAIEAAGQVLGNERNRVILDYQVQFYSQAQVGRAGGADLGLLRTGEWIVAGRPAGETAEFWRTDLDLDRRSGHILRRETGEAVNAPYVKVAIMNADAQVPKVVMDRSEALVTLLSTTAGKNDVDKLESTAHSLFSSIEGFVATRRLKKFRSVADLGAMVALLDRHDSQVKATGRELLSTQEVRQLLFTLERATGQQFGDIAAASAWWTAHGGAGRIVEDPASPLGFIFKP